MVQAAKSATKMSDFVIERKLGEGSFSEVYRVRRKSDGSVYAMKKVKMGKLTAKEKENSLNEVRILASVNHPNVIGYKEAFFEDATNCLCLVMENADGGDLLMLINNHKKGNTNFTEKQCWHFFIQIIRGLKALHDLRICHRDIKCANVFLTKEGVVKLGDMNVSRVAKGGIMRTQTGTPYYACPEVWKDMPYDNRSDIWSAGCVLYEMIMKMPPFRAQTMKGLYAKVLSGKYDPIHAHFTDDMKKVLRSCLQVRASERPKCDKILNMPGLLNHITGTLDDIQALIPDQENLMKTIRMPRRMGEITDRLPAPQYDQPLIKRTRSQPQSQLEVIENNSQKKMQSANKPSLDGVGRNEPAKQTATLQLSGNTHVEVESKSLIQKAHELYNNNKSSPSVEKKQQIQNYRTPEKQNPLPLSLADRAARINHEQDLPAIDEAYDKENDTFAQGGPIAALKLHGQRREATRLLNRRESSAQASSRIHSQDRSHLRSAEPSSGKKDYKLYREPNDQDSIGIGMLARNGLPPRVRNSHQTKLEAMTPGANPTKGSDLIASGEQKLALPRIQSSRSNQLSQPSLMHRQLSRQKMLNIQRTGAGGGPSNDFSTQASQQSKQSKRSRQQYMVPLGEQKNSNEVQLSAQGLSPKPPRSIGGGGKYGSRPNSIQRNAIDDLSSIGPPSYVGGGTRAEQSALDHIRRMRRNMPSQQNSRMSHDLSHEYLSAMPISSNRPQVQNSKIENYKRIKQEEAAARALLMAPVSRAVEPSNYRVRNSELSSHRRHQSLIAGDRKYRPSDNAMAQYAPLNQRSQNQIPAYVPPVTQNAPSVIQSSELAGLRNII